MEYYGKKLPKGFIYLLTKKDLLEVNNQLENSILNVRLDGTSYSESKISNKSLLSKQAIYLSSYLVAEEVCFSIMHFGIRESNFSSSEEVSNAKLSIISKLRNICQNKKEDHLKNIFVADVTYLWVDFAAKASA